MESRAVLRFGALTTVNASPKGTMIWDPVMGGSWGGLGYSPGVCVCLNSTSVCCSGWMPVLNVVRGFLVCAPIYSFVSTFPEIQRNLQSCWKRAGAGAGAGSQAAVRQTSAALTPGV